MILLLQFVKIKVVLFIFDLLFSPLLLHLLVPLPVLLDFGFKHADAVSELVLVLLRF